MKFIFIFLLFFAVGFGIIQVSDNQFQVQRHPAAIRQIYDFTSLKGSSLEMALKQRVIGNMEIVRNQDGFGLRLGHFAFTNTRGERVLGCSEYKKMTFVFEAEGEANNGSKPRMEVEGACVHSEDLTMIKPSMVPIFKIVSEKPNDGDFHFSGDNPVGVRFLNISESWPQQWVLTDITLEGEKERFTMDRLDISRIIGQPLVIQY